MVEECLLRYDKQLESRYIDGVDTDNNIIHDLLDIYLVVSGTFGRICVASTLPCHNDLMEYVSSY